MSFQPQELLLERVRLALQEMDPREGVGKEAEAGGHQLWVCSLGRTMQLYEGSFPRTLGWDVSATHSSLQSLWKESAWFDLINPSAASVAESLPVAILQMRKVRVREAKGHSTRSDSWHTGP